MKKKLIEYPLELEKRILAVLGKGRHLNKFINQAIEEKLNRETVKG